MQFEAMARKHWAKYLPMKTEGLKEAGMLEEAITRAANASNLEIAVLTLILLCVTAALNGCASTGVVPTDQGIYMIAKKSAAGVFGTTGGIRADVYAEANEFCARTSKAVETVSIEVKDAIPFVRTGSVMLQFKCVSP